MKSEAIENVEAVYTAIKHGARFARHIMLATDHLTMRQIDRAIQSLRKAKRIQYLGCKADQGWRIT